jgi:hypothetical protein
MASTSALSITKNHSDEIDELCEVMFIAGARLLGFEFQEEMPLEEQEKIMEAAAVLAHGLRDVLMMEAGNGKVRELGN